MVGNPPSPLPLHVPSKNDSGATAGWMDNEDGGGAGGSSPSIFKAMLTLFSRSPLFRRCWLLTGGVHKTLLLARGFPRKWKITFYFIGLNIWVNNLKYKFILDLCQFVSISYKFSFKTLSTCISQIIYIFNIFV